jgi:hypothetical protein
MAGLTEDGKTCIRPQRDARPSYISYKTFKDHNVLPGTILEANFTNMPEVHAPHIEDRYFDKFKIRGICTSAQFEDVLRASSHSSLAAGFGIPIRGKVLTETPTGSIITLSVKPGQFTLIGDGFNPDKVKANITDGTGLSLNYLSITDLGFHDYVGHSKTRRMSIDEMNAFINTQDDIYLRIGLSRQYQADDGRDGYWLQVNGIYTFPNFEQVLRAY